jgi:branched-chain amino acid transport system permease protein
MEKLVNLVRKQKSKKVIFIVFSVIILATTLMFSATKVSSEGSYGGISKVAGMLQTALVYGVFYALLSLGFALIFGAARIVNLYHGTFYMLGAYLFATFANPAEFKFPFSAFLIVQLAIAGIIGLAVYKSKKSEENASKPFISKMKLPISVLLFLEVPLLLLFFKISLPVSGNINLFISVILVCGLIGLLSIFMNKYFIQPVKKESVAVLIITIALAFFTEKVLDAIYGSSNVRVPSFVETHPVKMFFDAAIDSKRLLMFFAGLVLILAVWLLMNRTKIGKGVLAVSQDNEAAMMMGINTKFVYNFAIGLSAVLAALAGVLTTPFLGDASPGIWLGPLIKSFAIVILGGLGSIFGSILAAFILALVEKFTKFYISSSLEEIVFLVVVIIILLVRPQGLFGKKGRF